MPFSANPITWPRLLRSKALAFLQPFELLPHFRVGSAFKAPFFQMAPRH